MNYNSIKRKEIREDKLRRNANIADFIDQTVCDYFNCTLETLKIRKRTHLVSKPRQFATYFLHKFTDLGPTLIGERNGFTHAAAIHMIDQTEFDINHNCERIKIYNELNPKIECFVKQGELEEIV